MDKTIIIPDIQNVAEAAILVRYANAENVVIANGYKPAYKNNPYQGKPGLQPATGHAENNPYDGRNELRLTQDPDKEIAFSPLNTKVFTDLTILDCSYINNLTGQTVTLSDSDTPGASIGTAQNTGSEQQRVYMNFQTVLITVSQSIKVVKTEIQGRNGTVKEYIGASDAQITINGIITGRNGVYPRNEVVRLKKWLDAPVSKKVVSWWLNNLGVHYLVVESYEIPQVEGGYSYQTFKISAVADAPVELYLTVPHQS
jgi:hypothetical protein